MPPNINVVNTFTNKLNTTFDLPRDKDKGSSLIEIKYPQKSFEDLNYSPLVVISRFCPPGCSPPDFI